MVKQDIEHNPKFSNHPSYRKDELGELLGAIISKTSFSGTGFKNKLRDCTESPHRAKITSITVDGYDTAYSRIPVRIQLAGNAEIWIIDVNLKRGTQSIGPNFRKEMKKASQIVCREEARKSEDDKKNNLVPDLDLEKKDLGGDKTAGAIPKPSNKRMYVRTSEVVTDDKVLEILQKWLIKTGGVQRISQREFGEIISSVLGESANKQLVVLFLSKKAVVNVIPIKGKPQLEIGEGGLLRLDEFNQQQEQEKQDAEKLANLQKSLEFPKKVLSSLRKTAELQKAYAELSEIKSEKNNSTKRVEHLKKEISTEEKKLTQFEMQEQKVREIIERLISSLSKEGIAELIAIAEK